MGGVGDRSAAAADLLLEGERHHHPAIGRDTAITDTAVAAPTLIVPATTVPTASIFTGPVAVAATALLLATRVLPALG